MNDAVAPDADAPRPARAAPHRGVLWVSGRDAKTFLHDVVSCDVAGLRPGAARYGALLTPQGKIAAEMFLYAAQDDSGLWLDAAADELEPLTRQLTLRRLRADVQFEPRADMAVVQDWADGDERAGAPDPRGVGGRRSLLDAERAAGTPALSDADRIAAGLPGQGQDYDADSVFPSDVNLDLLNGVDYGKGCFIGQEVVSRMKRRGVIRKRTVIAHGEGLSVGAVVTDGDLDIGEVTSVSAGVALVRARLDRLTAQSRLSCGNSPVRLVAPAYFPDDAKALTHPRADA